MEQGELEGHQSGQRVRSVIIIGLAQKEADKIEITLSNLEFTSAFVLSNNMIVEDVVGLCTCTYKKVIVYYSIVLCCGMYEEYYLPTNCDNVAS